MNVSGCLDRATSGAYCLDGKSVPDLDPDDLAALRRHTFGFIFQRYNLISGLTAVGNVEMPAIYAGMSHHDRHDRASELLVSLGLKERLHYRPSQLSGGNSSA